MANDPFGARETLTTVSGDVELYSLKTLDKKVDRVVMQDFTGVPAIVDLAAMRSAMESVGGDPGKINPLVPTDLVIDHSVQVDAFGTPAALRFNAEREFERNRERYE